jgi:hypothetical protein
MDWYYAEGTEHRGPITEDELRRLSIEGIIKSTTLVWRSGMPQWIPRSRAALSPPEGMLACAACTQFVPTSEAFLLGEASYCAACKPMVLQRVKDGIPIVSPAIEEVRKTYLNHETSIRSLSLLYLIGGVMFAATTLMAFNMIATQSAARTMVLAFSGILSFTALVISVGLRRLKRWVRFPIGFFSGLILLSVTMNLLLGSQTGAMIIVGLVTFYILYLVFSKKGRMVFSLEYQEIIRQTPHIKRRSSVILWILLGLLILLIIGAIAAAISG